MRPKCVLIASQSFGAFGVSGAKKNVNIMNDMSIEADVFLRLVRSCHTAAADVRVRKAAIPVNPVVGKMNPALSSGDAQLTMPTGGIVMKIQTIVRLTRSAKKVFSLTKNADHTVVSAMLAAVSMTNPFKRLGYAKKTMLPYGMPRAAAM